MLSIIIPTKDRPNILNKSLEYLKAATSDLDCEVLIINDGRDDFNLNFQRVQVIKNMGHGAASARNTGAQYSKGERLLFLDDDIMVSKKNINRALYLLEQHPQNGFNFSWKYPDETTSILDRSLHGRFILRTGRHNNAFRIPEYNGVKGLIETEGLSSQFFLIERSSFEKAGGYDDRIPLAGVEDIILAKRLNSIGVKVLLSLEDWVYHNETDRLSIDSLIGRFTSGAKTVRVANELGYNDIDIGVSWAKKTQLKAINPFRGLIHLILNILPNNIFYDYLYTKLAGVLLALGTYRGYYESN